MPPTITIHFDPAGGPLSAFVQSGFANPGSYGLTLLGPGATSIVQQFNSNFGTPTENTHPLGAAAQQDGRVLDQIAVIGLLDPGKAFSAFLTVIQDGKELGTVSQTGTGTGLTQMVELIVNLSATAAASVTAALGSGKKNAKTKKLPSRAVRRAEVKGRAAKVVAKAKADNPVAPRSARKVATKVSQASAKKNQKTGAKRGRKVKS